MLCKSPGVFLFKNVLRSKVMAASPHKFARPPQAGDPISTSSTAPLQVQLNIALGTMARGHLSHDEVRTERQRVKQWLTGAVLHGPRRPPRHAPKVRPRQRIPDAKATCATSSSHRVTIADQLQYHTSASRRPRPRKSPPTRCGTRTRHSRSRSWCGRRTARRRAWTARRTRTRSSSARWWSRGRWTSSLRGTQRRARPGCRGCGSATGASGRRRRRARGRRRLEVWARKLLETLLRGTLILHINVWHGTKSYIGHET